MLASITEKSSDSEHFVLPPIRTLDEYIPKKQHHDQHNSSNSFTMLSPPNSYSSSATSPPSSSSAHSPISIQRPPSPPRTAFEKMDTPIYPLGAHETSVSASTATTTTTTTNNNNSTLRTVSSDVDQVVHQANSLCNNMVHYKPYLLSTDTAPNHDEELRPWMDDMIGKANQVLNALLRLRKHQMVSSPTTHAMAGSADHPTTAPFSSSFSSSSSPPSSSTFSSTFSSLPSPPSSSTSSSLQMTLTKRDWANASSHHRYPYHHHRQHSSEMASIPSRQRKRGKRATFQGRCHSCNISETPEWRRGPDGARTLCNACGLHYAKLARKKAASSSSTSQKNQVSSR